jgi:hypothetical protein
MDVGVREKIGTTPVPSRTRSVTDAYAIRSDSESRPATWVVKTESNPSSSASRTRSSAESRERPAEMKAPIPDTTAFISVQCASSAAWAGGRDSSASDVTSRVPRAAPSRTSIASSSERA